MKLLKFITLFIFSALITSCVVRAPKYAGVEEVLQLKLGMTREEVSKTLGVPPYDLKSVSDKEVIYIYKYRTTERNTFPFLMNKTNGVKSKGKWVDLFITYDLDSKVTNIASCSDCETTKVDKKKLDVNALVLLLTVTLPALAVYFGLQTTP